MHAEAAASRDSDAAPAIRRPRLLLVEDSARLAASIRDYLERHHYEVFIEGDGLAVAERFERLRPDLVILDLMLPGKDGLTLCRELRRHDRIPILILTAKGENIDQVLGLEMGADDYVVKPVEPRVLLARIEALLRRARSAPPQAREPRLVAGRLAIDSARRAATIDSRAVELTTGDFDILWLLASRQGTVVTRDEILRVVRGIDY
ncbi:MAG TPA: response regulator transcription factor, partial [Myxococcota bacterium]|nr:response regulator transcription factor [Myxococcota bacterium]